LDSNASQALATEQKVLPVPAGPIAIVTMFESIDNK
jgi:hypothetical protein